MSLVLKKTDEINLFSSIIYHATLCVFLTLLIIRNAALAINILVYVIRDTLSTFIKQFIMIATERSASIAKSCFVLIEFLAVNYIKYIDFDDQKQKISEQNSIKSILANASKRVQAPVRKGAIAAPIKKAPVKKAPVVSAEILKKSEAARQIKSINTNQPTEATPLANFSALSLRKAEKENLPLEQRYRPSIPSPLGNNSKDLKSLDYCPSKRYSTPASEGPKRTMTMKFINSTAANRIMRRKKQRQDDDEDDYDVKAKQQQKSATKQKPNDLNLNLFDERPAVAKPSRTRLNKPPEVHLQTARRYLKVMIKVKKHRNTI